MLRLTTGVTLAAVGSASASKNSAISKVIDMLKVMKSDVETETAKGAKEAETTEKQCIADISKLEGDVKYTGEKAEEANAQKEQFGAKASTYASEAESLVPEIAESEVSKKKAKEAHDKEAHAFAKEEAEMTEAITMLTQAYSVLKQNLGGTGSFLQTKKNLSGAMSSNNGGYTRQVVAALRSIVDAAWVDAKATNVQELRAFLDDHDSANTGLTAVGTAADLTESSTSSTLSLASGLSAIQLAQPQAEQGPAYKSKSGGILDAIAGMQEKAESELAGLREKALKSKHAFELLSQDLLSKIELKTEQMEAAKTNSADATAQSESGAADAAEAEDTLGSLKSQLTDTQAGCKKVADDWAERSAEAEEEVAAIAKATEILSGKFGASTEASSFVQLKTRSFLSNSDRYEAGAQAAILLRQLGEKFSNYNMMQVASAVSESQTQKAEGSLSGDPFTKVRKMINDMIVKLEDAQAEEAAKEGKCKADKAKGTKQMKKAGSDLKALQAKADKNSAKVSELATDISEMSEEVKLLQQSRSAWQKERASSSQENKATIKEAVESIEALNQAISALEEFYGGGASATAFLQTRTSTAGTGDKASAIIEILQTAQTDFEKIRQVTEKGETDAKASFEKDMQDSEVTLAKTNASIEGKSSEQATLKSAGVEMDEDLSRATKAVEAAGDYMKSVNEACAAEKPLTFEEKQAKRKQEIDGLKEALEILGA